MESDKIFEALKIILAQHEASLQVHHNKASNYYLNTPAKGKKAEFFGAVQIKKSYVAFHLMPVYYFPELLSPISSGLKSKMQGKSCFNFKSVDEELFEELASLTMASFSKYQALGKV